ncbi:MAG: ArsC/Spx/MgsR family protein, partial [Candidatus Thermoplasmatota archaeon]|nr:ArsC/Spx/MgsR family protein [Candidatus Thermoplasmatota archaeon]
KNLDSDGIQTLLKEQPKCLERPVLVLNGQAVVGRPPERVLEFLQSQ